MPSEKPLQHESLVDRVTEEWAVTRPLTAAVFAVFVLVAVASFLPRAQLWGVNHLAFYSVPVRLLALLLIAVTFLPPVARRLYVGMLAVSRTIKEGDARVDLVLTMVAVASVLVFTQLRVSTNLLGDGQLIAQSYEAAWEGNDEVIMRSTKAIVLEERIAPGATLMYYGAAKVVTAVTDRGPVWGIRMFVAMLGAFFVYLIMSLIRAGPFSREVRLWLLVLALFSTTIQMFFGYVENYAPLVFFGLFYVIASFLVLHGKGRLWVAIVLFIVTVYTHIQAVLFAPSLLYLILWRASDKRRADVQRYAGPALTAAIVLVAAAVAFTPFGYFYLPLLGDEQSYGLFSPIHLADVVNEVLMLMPILPLFAVMVWVNRSRSPNGRTKEGGKGAGATGWFAMTVEWHFVFLMLIPCLVYLFLFKPEIGMARDWDLFTMTCLGLVPLALLIVNRFFRRTGMQSDAGSFTTPAVAIYVVLAVAWVGINASSARSTARFHRILDYDRTHASYAYENLSIFYYDSGQLDEATEMMEIACDISHNPRQYVRLAMYYSMLQRGEEALELMRRTVSKHPDFEKARFYLISLLQKGKLHDELLEVAREGTSYHPEAAIYWFYFGEISLRKGNTEDGVAALEKCLTLDPPEGARKTCIELIDKYSENQE
jgi:Tfp pilus assembly protein PilF